MIMKRLLFFNTCLALFIALISVPTARATVTVNAANFPDANFRAAVAQAAGVSSDGGTFSEASLTTLDLPSQGVTNVTNLKGLELLTGLTYLNISGNTLTTGADLRQLTALTCVTSPRWQRQAAPRHMQVPDY